MFIPNGDLLSMPKLDSLKIHGLQAMLTEKCVLNASIHS